MKALPHDPSDQSGNSPSTTPVVVSKVERLPESPRGDAGARPAILTSGANASMLFAAFRRRWLLALTLALIVAGGLGVAGWIFFPEAKFSVYSLFEISSNQPQIVFATRSSQDDFSNYRKTMLSKVKNPEILRAALARPEVVKLNLKNEFEDPLLWLQTKLKTDFTLGPELLRISLDGYDTEELKVIITAITETYFQKIIGKERTKRNSKYEELRKLYTLYEDRLRNKREALRSLAKDIGTTAPENMAIQQRMALEQLARVEVDLGKLRSDAIRLTVEIQTKLAQKKGITAKNIPNSTFDQFFQKDAGVQGLQAKIAKLETTIADIRRLARPAAFENASREERQQLEAAKKALDERRKQLRESLPTTLLDKIKQEADDKIATLQGQLAFFQNLEKTLQQESARLASRTKKINTKSLNLEELKEEIAQAEGVLKRISSEAEAFFIERDAPSRIEVLNTAEVTRPDNLKLKIAAVAGGSVGLFALIIFGITWWEYSARKVNSVSDVVDGLGLRLMGTLPSIPSRVRGYGSRVSGPTANYWSNLLTESVDGIRTLLLHAPDKDPIKVIMVSSAMGGEGKTSLATHLAASLVRARRKTVLVDCDLRNPSVHRLFELPRSPGFSELLRKEATLDEVIQTSGLMELDVISAGNCDHLALQELAQDGCGSIMKQLKERYDFIVVDSAPILPVVDSLLVAIHTDAVIFSIMHEVSQLPKVYAAYQRLELLGVRVLGVAVNGTPGSQVYGFEYRYLKESAATG